LESLLDSFIWDGSLSALGGAGSEALAGSIPRAGGRGGGYFVGIDFGLAHKGDPLLDDELGGADCRRNNSALVLMSIFFFGHDIAVDLASNHNGIGADVALDDGVIAEVERAFRIDVTIEFSIEGQFAGKLDSAFDFYVRAKGVFSCWFVSYSYLIIIVHSGSSLCYYGSKGCCQCLKASQNFDPQPKDAEEEWRLENSFGWPCVSIYVGAVRTSIRLIASWNA